MKLWSLQPKEVADALERGEPYICTPKLAEYYEEEDSFRLAYDWLVSEMELSIPKPDGVTLPAWAWFRHYGVNTKPDRRFLMFNSYALSDYVILELEVPEDEVLLSGFDDWHLVLGDSPIFTEEQYREDDYPEHTEAEKRESWRRIFEIENVEFVQACVWQIKPEHVVKLHRPRRRNSSKSF
jgi:hypothetical protein